MIETDNMRAERCGAALAQAMLDDLMKRRNEPQAEQFTTVAEALGVLTLFKDEHIEAAAAGFAGSLVSVLMLGVANLPKGDAQ